MEIDTSTTHPNPTPNPHHRKIDLQSAADLLYLQSALTTSALQKLTLHFPPNAYKPQPPATHIPLSDSNPLSRSFSQQGEEPETDPLRARVSHLVSAFLFDTWAGAKQNIALNGMDATLIPDLAPPGALGTTTTSSTTNSHEQEIEGITFQYTPYDPRLNTQLASLYSELESLTASVSALRRVNPHAAAERYQNTINDAVARDQEVFESRRRELDAEKERFEMEMEELPQDVAAIYERGLAELSGLGGKGPGGVGEANLKSSLTETVGKVQRARRVVLEME